MKACDIALPVLCVSGQSFAVFLSACHLQVWDLFYEADKVREMLTRLIQEEALRTYLFTYSHVYDSISMPTLAQMFELEKPVVHSIISKMIINEELMVNLSTTILLNLKRTTVKSLLC
jgi:translation initiation factor 3 subunit C